MTLTDVLAIAVPCAAITLGVFAIYAGPLGTLIAEKTHNERLGRIVSAAGRVAAEISAALAALPPGAPAAALRASLITAGVKSLRDNMPSTVAAVGATDPQLATVISGELAKLPATPIVADAVSLAAAVIAAPPGANA